MKAYLIVNPASASGRTARHFDVIARAVRSAVGHFECAFTRRVGDGSELAREASRCGAELVVAVGGDGTASEVVHGILTAGGSPGRPAPVFGCIPRGTGGDLRRSLSFPEGVEEAARVLAAGATREMDIGRVDLVGHDGRPVTRHFPNVADFGVGGLVAEKVENGSKALGGRLAFKISTARALFQYADQPVRWRADGGEWREQRLTNLSVCNGRYFGGGMLVAPDAAIDDGLFDVIVWSGFRLGEFLFKQRMLYDGSHVSHPKTRTLRARVVEAEPVGGARVLLDVDGEQPGVLPARFTLVPRALKVKVRA